MSDFDDLERLERLLETWPDLLPDVAALAAPSIQADARSKYRAGNDCFGTPMPPRKADGARALARPLSTVTFANVGASIVGSAEEVLRYHQGPIFTAPYPQRKTFPAEGEALPSEWDQAIERSTDTVIGEFK